MNKSYTLVGILIVAILGAGYYAYSQKSTESSSISTDSPIEENIAVDTETAIDNPGMYKEYSENELTSTEGTKLLFFHAPWCSQCRQLDESISTSNLPSDTTIFKVDYDSNQGLRQKYGVTMQTTIVKVDDNGDKIASYVAYQSPTFENVKAALLSD